MVAPLALMGLSLATNVVGKIADAIGDATKSSQPVTPAKAADGKIRKTADDFESMFLEQSMNQMTESSGPDGPLGENGTGGGVYRSMLMNEYAGQIVKSGGVGIGDQVYRQMLALQEKSGHAGG